MTLHRIGWCALLSLLVSSTVWAQHPLRGPAEPDQPVRPEIPTLVPRGPQPLAVRQPQPPPPPFTLTQEEEAQVDHVLAIWEKRNLDIKTFDCKFKRWTYDLVFSPPKPNQPPQPRYIDVGVIKYAAPDRGMYRVETTENGGKEVTIEDARADHWISDGKSIFEYKYTTNPKQLIEHKLPPQLQGKAIADSPLPFLFGAEAQKLKQRYFIRILQSNVPNQIILEAYPRSQQDAANFHHALFIINARDMSPFALQLFDLNGKDYKAYGFYEIVVNDPLPLRFFRGDPFRGVTPSGWQKIVEEPPTAQAGRVPSTGVR